MGGHLGPLSEHLDDEMKAMGHLAVGHLSVPMHARATGAPGHGCGKEAEREGRKQRSQEWSGSDCVRGRTPTAQAPAPLSAHSPAQQQQPYQPS